MLINAVFLFYFVGMPSHVPHGFLIFFDNDIFTSALTFSQFCFHDVTDFGLDHCDVLVFFDRTDFFSVFNYITFVYGTGVCFPIEREPNHLH